LDKEKKLAIMKSYAINEKDTGSSDVQVAVLTERIIQLSAHLKEHSHDQHTRRSLQAYRESRYVGLSGEKTSPYRTLIASLDYANKSIEVL
jgi:small subunit ribosomal protein S15